jgi:hypothetical protein
MSVFCKQKPSNFANIAEVLVIQPYNISIHFGKFKHVLMKTSPKKKFLEYNGNCFIFISFLVMCECIMIHFNFTLYISQSHKSIGRKNLQRVRSVKNKLHGRYEKDPISFSRTNNRFHILRYTY